MKQDYPKIEERIERFFAGESSNEEEQELYAFFSSENVPEHLLQYRPVFVYFESGIKDEEIDRQPDLKNIQSLRKKRISFWASIAASLLFLVSFGIYHFYKEKDFNPYEGSYIIRNGVRITDPKIVNPEIEKTIDEMLQQKEEFIQLSQVLYRTNKDPHIKIAKEIKQQQMKWVEQLKDETIRNKVLKIIDSEL